MPVNSKRFTLLGRSTPANVSLPTRIFEVLLCGDNELRTASVAFMYALAGSDELPNATSDIAKLKTITKKDSTKITKLHIWNVLSLSEYQEFYKSAAVVFLCFDVNKPATFYGIRDLMVSMKQESPQAVFMLLGLNDDREKKRLVSLQNVQALMEDVNSEFQDYFDFEIYEEGGVAFQIENGQKKPISMGKLSDDIVASAYASESKENFAAITSVSSAISWGGILGLSVLLALGLIGCALCLTGIGAMLGIPTFVAAVTSMATVFGMGFMDFTLVATLVGAFSMAIPALIFGLVDLFKAGLINNPFAKSQKAASSLDESFESENTKGLYSHDLLQPNRMPKNGVQQSGNVASIVCVSHAPASPSSAGQSSNIAASSETFAPSELHM